MSATRHPMTALRVETRDRVHRARLEALRAAGRYRELVLWLLGAPEPWQDGSRAVRSRPNIEPTAADLAGALREVSADPLPAPIGAYIAGCLLKTDRRKRGTKTSSRSTQDDDQVLTLYAAEYLRALVAYKAREAPPADRVTAPGVATQAKRATAKKSGWSVGTVESILAARQLVPKK